MAFVVELLLPVADPEGRPYPTAIFGALQRELTERFGGVTAHVRAPAQGRWKDGDTVEADDVVLFEVMTDTLDREWWRRLRVRLQTTLRQREVLMRAHEVERL